LQFISNSANLLLKYPFTLKQNFLTGNTL